MSTTRTQKKNTLHVTSRAEFDFPVMRGQPFLDRFSTNERRAQSSKRCDNQIHFPILPFKTLSGPFHPVALFFLTPRCVHSFFPLCSRLLTARVPNGSKLRNPQKKVNGTNPVVVPQTPTSRSFVFFRIPVS
jgi:hypothetical protein